LSLYGHIAAGPASEFYSKKSGDEERLRMYPERPAAVADLEIRPGDWPTYLANNERTPITGVAIPRRVKRDWTCAVSPGSLPTAPVIAGGLTFFGDGAGAVRAIDSAGAERWKVYTGGAVHYPPAIADGRAYVGSADGRVHAIEAATGKRLWSYRVAPRTRWMPVYGKLMSTWPVAGGVIARDGVVYAAAGIAHYDGTHVVALDGATGEPRWSNDSSGTLSDKVRSGISLQGELFLAGGELRFLGGGVYHTARYDLETGKCLNEPYEGVNSQFATAFYSYFPEYGQYLSLEHTLADGRTLRYEAMYEGSRHSPLALLAPQQRAAPAADAPGEQRAERRQPPPRKALWEIAGHRFNCLVVGPDAILAAAQTGGDDRTTSGLAALDLETGRIIWKTELSSPAVKGGIAVGHGSRIAVSLQSGDVIGFSPES
ncbi:MAG: PQQ-binding-like beta-propeller repeat protein, partial [Planctomycetes bacterium]|nr:PQQ-binding-like beta-propeller repeat protein [Planctomycetota bacterium]